MPPDVCASAVADAALTTSDVTLSRDGRVFARLPDLRLAGGQAVALTGPSGSGKTTALLALAGVRSPASGAIMLGNTQIWALSAARRDRLRGQRIGMVFQSFHLLNAMTVDENLRLAASCAGLRADPAHLLSLLNTLGIEALRHRRSDHLSQGQAQRVAVARALMNLPQLILADEPTSALDDDNALVMLTLLRTTCLHYGAALLIATHDRRVLAELDGAVTMEAA